MDDERAKSQIYNESEDDGSGLSAVDEDDENDEDDDEDDDDGPVQSPLTDLFYNVDNLDDETQELVRELFRAPAPEETPPMVIEWCGISNDPDVFAFQLQELVPRTIRIGSPTSRIPRPSCNCTGTNDTPCRHLVWLMDQIAKQTLHDHPPDVPLVLDGVTGFPREIGSDVYARIADFHIDILANTLHCGAGPPSGRPNPHRLREAREILAGLDGVRDDDGVDTYAPEIFDQDQPALKKLLWGTERRDADARGYGEHAGGQESESGGGDMMDEIDDQNRENEAGQGNKANDGKSTENQSSSSSSSSSSRHIGDDRGAQIQGTGLADMSSVRAAGQHVVRDLVERGDLQRTVLRMLVSNDEFFAMFLKLLSPSDKARDPFRKIQQRVEAVLDALMAAWLKSHQQQQQQQQQRRQSQVLMPPPDPRTKRLASAPFTAGTAGASTPSSSREDSGTGVTVTWAAKHIESAVGQIHLLLQRQLPRPPGEWARQSAGRALVWILHALVFFHNRDVHGGATQDDRNLYQRLVGNSNGKDRGFFILDTLESLHDQIQLRAQLRRIRRRIQVNGYREPYMRKLDEILEKMKTSAAAKESSMSSAGAEPGPPRTAGSKRQGSNTNTPTDRKAKRMR
ncbi:MAG: hypothetical protein STHCBS139747_001322 [Sporothrix thermara]